MPRSDTDPLGHIKGAMVREFLHWYEQTHGRAELEAALGRIAPLEREPVDPSRPEYGILVSEWVPSHAAHRVVDALLHGMSARHADAMAKSAGPAVASGMMKGAQRLAFAMVMTPDRYRTHVQRLWNLNFDTGRAVVEKDGESAHVGVITGWRGHHPFICQLIVHGKLRIYEAMGCSGVSVVALECTSRGAKACRSRTSWERWGWLAGVRRREDR